MAVKLCMPSTMKSAPLDSLTLPVHRLTVFRPWCSRYAHVPLPVLAEAAHEASKMPFASLKNRVLRRSGYSGCGARIGAWHLLATWHLDSGFAPPPPFHGTEVARPYQMASACKPEPPPASLSTVSGMRSRITNVCCNSRGIGKLVFDAVIVVTLPLHSVAM